MTDVRYRIVELRQYTLRPGQRDVLIELFDRELIESQEAAGMTVVGQFRDLDRPDRFVWIRGFRDMQTRAQALATFYRGPVWKAHSREANATMLDSDDVLLLRPATAAAGFPPPAAARPPAGRRDEGQSRILVTLYHGTEPFDDSFTGFFEHEAGPALTTAGATPLAWLQTEYAENTFPALPVRTGEHVFAWLARFGGEADLDAHLARLRQSAAWQDRVLPALSARLARAPEQLRLAPTARSLLR
jgi:NIPSNAP